MSVVTPFPRTWDRHPIATFDRKELMKILDLYGRMVEAGHWPAAYCGRVQMVWKAGELWSRSMFLGSVTSTRPMLVWRGPPSK